MKIYFYIIFLLFSISCVEKNNTRSEEKVKAVQIDEYENLNKGESIITGGAQFNNQIAEDFYWKGLDQLKLKNKYAALKSFKKALNIEPENITILESIANLHSENGNYSDAIGIYEKILIIDSNSFSTNLNLGLSYYFKGDLVNSLKQFDLVIKKSNDSDQRGIAFFHKTEIYLILNECLNAKKSLQLADSLLKSETIRIHIKGFRNDIKKNCR